ncbi:hypothetical protein [Halovenus salina]|uniref:ATP-dependent helicase/nuclease subunit B n=1 Tax=Halovenus salina TaxID=1510225 RepID=A0ABD5W2V7_9EURY|nr:hypothetical protein [Halovenus salina]
MDRLRLIEEALESQPAAISRLTRVFGSSIVDQATEIEAAREELSVLTGYQPSRLSALETVCNEISTVASQDALDLLVGVRDLQKRFQERLEGYVSAESVVRHSCELLVESDGDAWPDMYADIERVNVVGISTLGTPLLEFLRALERTTSVTVHLYLRAQTGPRIADRLPARLQDSPTHHNVKTPSGAPPQLAKWLTTPATEIVAETRQHEARVAVALCESLLRERATVSEIAIVARDIDQYEQPLTRAASSYGRHLSVWTQLELTRTLPYRLLTATCSVLAAEATGQVDTETLFRPLTCYWLDPEAEDGHGNPPSLLTPAELSDLRRTLGANYSGSLQAWRDHLDATPSVAPSVRRRLQRYLEWCHHHSSSPQPDDILSVLGPVIDRFEQVVLPGIERRDTAAYTETSRAGRAVQRIAGDDDGEHLLREAREKFSRWRDRHQIEASWATVQEVIETIATARPGRREHDNAERIDVLDATDTWLRSYPFVIAMGFVDGCWPQQPHGMFPLELRTAVVRGDSPQARRLGIRGAWTEQRDYDHAADAIRTATTHLIATRFTEDIEGVRYQRSPLLDEIPTTEISDQAYHHLIGPDAVLPGHIRESLAGRTPPEGSDRR